MTITKQRRFIYFPNRRILTKHKNIDTVVNVNLKMGNYGHIKVGKKGREKLPLEWPLASALFLTPNQLFLLLTKSVTIPTANIENGGMMQKAIQDS